MRKALLIARKALPVALMAVGLVAGIVPVGVAGAAQPSWSGDYSLKRFAASKHGTSLAASQSEPDFADTYTFATDCSGGPCVATVIGGPPPDNPTLPQPATYTWDGTSWVHLYDWRWDCYMGAGVEKVWQDAHSEAYYTPQPDGTLIGSWTTWITEEGPCQGTVTMDVAAYPVRPHPPAFGSSGS
ncbi:hypothetical protein [Rhodococcus sp. IEGM 1379]|uniref:hypothetical protein n=1 Tax=Rhodococcus sp. IEGM 1379 TaxID=3047086 RepID=UPI0024B86BEF|nr:hypothetical protein [Rhodococcus sp. IEGM 1379]MDI9914961.1 hypothetical protein [Rhodococcus sp. IEGM 1379]